MNKKLMARFWLKGAVAVALLVLCVLGYQQGAVLSALATGASPAGTPATARVKQAWENVRLSSSYSFAADIVIETIPLPTAGNIGRFSKTDRLYVEGENHLDDGALQLAIWGGGVSVADRDSAYAVRTRDGHIETRAGSGEWQIGDESALAFAPEGDFLAFLDVAQNIAVSSDRRPGQDDPACAALDCTALAVYTFDLDGPGYAQQLTTIAQEQMQRSGKLPPGAAMQIPAHLAKITGSGELWVDGRGLPVRQKVTMSVPAAPGADNRTETQMDVRFTAYKGTPDLLTGVNDLQRLTRELARTQLPSTTDAAAGAGGLSLALAGAFLLIRPRRRTIQFVSGLMIVIILFTPLLQTGAFGVSTAQASDAKTQQATVERERTAAQMLLDRRRSLIAAGPYAPPETVAGAAAAAPATAAALQVSPTLDSDGDGLTDVKEELLGTNPYATDTDLDTVADNLEVAGFTYASKTWYGNPLLADTNQDGVFDGAEWDPSKPDTDGDGTPDLYDYDDDNDAVPDEVDISRTAGLKASSGVPVTFTEASPLQLTVDGLNPGSYTYVDLQLRPTNPDRLWYAFNVLNWPEDKLGNAQDWDKATFYDYCVRTGGSNCNMAPDANGDIKLVPMLEVAMPDLSTLPRRGNDVDKELLDHYGIAVQPAGDGTWLVYAPLTLMEDPVTESKVAFRGQLVYQGGATWKPQQARLVWTINLLNEQYENASVAQETLQKNGNKGDNQVIILHAYYDDFLLTGFNVREERGVEMAIVYEDPTLDTDPAVDDGLFQMATGLRGSYFTNRDCDLVNQGQCIGNGQRDLTIAQIAQRWNHATNTGITDQQRWGIGNYLSVETHSFPAQDVATMTGGGQIASQILDDHFKNTTVKYPALIFVQETKLRTLNADAGIGGATVNWSGSQVKVDFSRETVVALGSFRLAPYQKATVGAGWEPAPPATYADDLIQQHGSEGEGAQPGATEDTILLTDAKATYATINIVYNMKGDSEVLSMDAAKGAYKPLTLSGALPSFRLNLTDKDLRDYYTQALTEAGSRLAWMAVTVPQSGNDDFRYKWSQAISDETLQTLFRIKEGAAARSSDIEDVSEKVAAQVEFGNRTKAARMGVWAGSVFALFAGIGGIFALSTTNKAGQTAGEILVQSSGAVGAVLDAMLTAGQVANKLPTVGQNPAGTQLVKQGAKFLFGINSTIAKIGAVGAVIGLGLTWVVFFAAWGMGGLAPGSIAFNSLVAGAVAGTVVLVLSLIVSLTVVGAIVLAVVAVFDLFALIACKAGAKKACDIGIMSIITEALTDLIYTGGIMIDTDTQRKQNPAPPISTIKDLDMRLTNPRLGLVAGNGVQFEAKIETYVRHLQPKPGIVYHFKSFFTQQDIQSTSVKYALGPVTEKIKPKPNETWWSGVAPYGSVTQNVPAPVVGWLGESSQEMTLWQAIRNDTVVSPIYPFAGPKINQTFPLTLSIGMALPKFDCWYAACGHGSMQTTSYQNLSDKFVLDILPATITDFYNWSALGPQIDWDGDGVPAKTDPNDRKWDTDGDGLPDGVELRDGLDPHSADADVDRDGLADADEVRYGTSPRRADTDGDGISDLDEVKGYAITTDGLTSLTQSDPLRRDTDRDGISDGAERRLNSLDPVRYPFHPQAYNDPPARIYSSMEDVDGVLAVGASTKITTTVVNGTAVENALVAAGVFSATLPAQLGGAFQARAFTLPPTGRASIVLNAVAASANGLFIAQSGVAADVAPVGAPPTGAPDDIILDKSMPVIIDSDQPDVPALTLGAFVQPATTVIIGGTASDPTSYVAKVEVSINNVFSTATGTSLWAFPVAIPNTPSGIVPINVRAVDAVNNMNSANYVLNIDGAPPVLTVNLNSGDLRRVRRNASGAWTLPISGTVTDALAGMDTLTLQIGASSNAVFTTTAIGPGGSWNVEYAFDDLLFNADPRPTGNYTLTVTARDTALPGGNATTQEIPFVIDMTPPTVALLSHADERQLTDGTVLTGTVADANAPVQSVEVAFVSAQTALSTGNTLLRLPLNDLPQTTLFQNTAAAQTPIYCLDDCPTSGVDGADGTAAAFGGNDLLRSFEPIDLPESGLTTALWFKTTCANCGLFSTIQGVYPAVVQHDRELYLDAGKVCSAIVVGGSRETRCSATNSYADGQWHQVVHTLGASGNALYVDGQLAVSSPTTASTFAAQDGVLVGYAPAAATPFLTGALDDLVIYDGALPAESAAALYRQWRPVTFSGGAWSFTVPQGLEGYYQIDMRAADAAGNYGDDRSEWAKFRGPIDTRFPTFAVQAGYAGSGSAALTQYRATIRDYNLTTDNYEFVCPLTPDQLTYTTDPALAQLTDDNSDPVTAEKLTAITAACTVPGFQTSLVAASACDALGHCGAAMPPQAVAYIGTYENRLLPFGSLPNAIERANLSDPDARVRLIERPGSQILDIAVDEARNMIYWAEMKQGDYAQPGAILRANLSTLVTETLVSGLTVYGAEALQMAVDTAGNKLYWTKGHELWWANLDGSGAQVAYTIDRATPGVSQIGDVVVDGANGRLYLSERRLRGTLAGFNAAQSGNVTYIPFHARQHTVIVATDLNGANPEFFAGVAAGCTYANYYDKQGTGTGLGLQGTTCLIDGSNGFDVEAMTVRDGALYWSAIDSNGVTAGVYGRTPGQAAFTVAPLALPGNSDGLRTTPLPQLYVDENNTGVFVQLPGEGWDAGQIVRGERAGEFTLFTSFADGTPPAPGTVRRSSSKLSAMAVVVTAQEIQTDTDLAVGITSPALVMVNGGTARYDITLRNDGALAAADTVLTLALPAGASYAGASQACVDGGATVTCDLGRFVALSQQTVAISFTVATAEVRVLTGTVSVASTTAERTPANNTASHSRITAAPTLAALSGLPYIYYGDLSRLTRVPLFGSHVAEPLFLDPPIAGEQLAADLTRNRLYMLHGLDKLVAVDPDGRNRVELADANQAGLNPSNRLYVAVDETTGRVFWSEVKSLYLTTIKSANPDGTAAVTVTNSVLNQRGLLVDPIRRKLFWVGSDAWQRQELIYRSELDGSSPEVVYGAPEGMEIRALTIDPYNQKLYWLDPATADGALFWADADGNRLAQLAANLGSDARGLIVRPYEDALYYVRGNDLVQAKLDGRNPTVLADLSQRPYTGLYLPVSTTSFGPTYINRPTGNLAFVTAAPFAAPPCTVNDSHEPNNSAGAATAIGLGVTTGALCKTDAALPQDIDFYTVTVPDGQQLNATLSGLPADYDLYVQRAGVTLAISRTAGLANETIALANYEGDGPYTIVVFSSTPVNNVAPYTLTVGLTDAPPQTVFSNSQCLAVDPADAAGLTGNNSQGQATPLTVGSVITGALCYQNDVDFFAFNATTGQRLTLDLPERPADYELHLYRPDGTFYNGFNSTGVWTYPAPVSIDATGTWAVAVRMPNLTPTLSPYQLLVTESTCSINDPWEPNNSDAQAAALGAPSRVNATLCAANDVDNYRLTATAGQTLTVNYPANASGAVLRLLSGAGAEVGRILPGSQGNFVLPATGAYTLVAANSALTRTDMAYMFQWLLDAPQVAPDKQYLYYTDGLLYRVALSADHTTEPIFLTTTLATAGPAIVADGARDFLYSYNPLDGDGYIVRSNTDPFDGSGYTTVVTAPNPDGVAVPPVAVAVDESTGRIYWVQPRGASASLGSTIRRANSDGTDNVAIIGAGVARTSLVVDSIRGLLYWTENGAIQRSDLDGANVTTLRAAVAGQTPTDLALDPFAQRLYWLDTTQRTIYRASADGSNVTALVTGLDANTRGVAVQPRIALYYSSGGVMLQAALDGSDPLTITTLAGAYNGPSNLDPNAFPSAVIAAPQSQLTIGSGTPLVSPCTLADRHEPNNDPGSATPLTVVTETVTYGALCNSVLNQPADWDYYTVTVAAQQMISVTLSEMPANYRVIVRNAAGLNLAFSDNDGLADDFAAVSNTSSTTTTYTILVLGYGLQNTNRYKLTLEVGAVPPPPGPSNEQCSFVDVYDTPGTGNGTLATATPLPFDTLLAAALCYTADVDMYAFDGLAGQTLTIDLPIRPQDYNLTLYDRSGTATAVISSTTTPAYGGSVTLVSSGRYTVSVSQPSLVPTEAQYQLLVRDENCVASDANEPNDSAAFATPLANGSRVRATLCNQGDMDLYTVSATTGQQLTLNYPANATGAIARVVPATGGGDLGQVTAGSQGVFNIPADGDYRVVVENAALASTAVPYQFELLVGAPTTPPGGSPYIYYSRASDLVRTSVVTGTVEPLLLPDGFSGGSVLASNPVSNTLYILDNLERIVRTNPDGSNPLVVVADTDPNDVLRFTESLAVDERSGRIYWVQPRFGIVGDILSANGDGSNVRSVVTDVVADHGITVDPVGGRLYWAQTSLHNGAVVDHIRRANLDGTGVETVYAAPEGNQIRELTVDPFAQTLYWRDPTQNRLLQTAADGSGAVVTVANVGAARGFVVRPLQNELYYTADSQLWRTARDGSSPVALARLDGAYNGVSNRDVNAFYPTSITPPGSNLALAFGAPFVTPCSAVDGYEPNNTLTTAAAIAPGTLSAALCTDDLTNPDAGDYYKLTVASGQQITVTLTDLPQDYGLTLIANGNFVAQISAAGTNDEVLTHANRTGAPVVYTILVLPNLAPSTRLPYTLDVTVAVAPPPTDPCASFDIYDAPGALGNGTRETATPITASATITAALCYDSDVDYYAFDGIVGQQITVDLSPRPADYGVNFYNPAGQLVKAKFPPSLGGSTLQYGDSFTLDAAGRWTVAVYDFPTLTPTTSQYALRLSSPACTGLDPYEPNDNEFSNPYAVSATNVTLRTMLCGTEDRDWYNFALGVGDRIRITPRVLTNGTNSNGLTVNMNIGIQPPGSGFGEITEPYEMIASSAGDFLLGVYTQPRVNNNLRYEIDVQITRAPARPTPPNNWTCTVYPSSDIPRRIEDLTTLASTVNVTTSGPVTWVGLKDITFNHGGLGNVSFGLAAPDGAQVDLFAFDDYGSYFGCGSGSNCRLSIDDWAIEGLAPPQFPNDGGTFRPSRNSFAPFDGKASGGVWTLYVSDDGLSDLGGDAGDTTGDLLGWSLEVCVDNGADPDPTPTPTPAPTPAPRTEDGAPPTAVAPPVVIATPTPPVCVATPDAFENDDSAQTAGLFDMAVGSSAGHNFHTVDDTDWYTVTLLAGLQYTLTASTVNPAQGVALAIYAADAVTTPLRTVAGQLAFTPAVSSNYYVRATSGSGLSVSLCDSNYSLVLTSFNPSATPVPTPVAGAALPPGHDAPQRSAAVLAPADGAVLTQLQPITVAVGLNAEDGIGRAGLFLDDVAIAGYTAPVSTTDTVWPSNWTPPGAGAYRFRAVVTDSLGVTATSPANVVYVDLAGPAVTVISETITVAQLASDGSYLVRGTATDDSQVAVVEVRLDGGPWQAALLDGGAWSSGMAPQAQANPDGGALAIAVRVTDQAGLTATAAANVLLDVTPPAAFASTTSLVSSGALISPSQVITDLNVRLSWPAITGAVSVYAGWTSAVTPTLGGLTAYGAGAGSHDQLMPEGTVLYAHVVAVDANGNQTASSQGPFYFDTAATPDLIADLAREDWVTSGGKQVGQMSTPSRGVQKLFAGWDATHLRLRWEGFNVDSEGDLYFYLGTGGGGTIDLFNPNGANQVGALPFSANYLVRVAGGITPTLYSAGGGAWALQKEVAALTSGDLTDVLLPFADLGIANPAATGLKLLGVAAMPGTLDVWATVPDQNLGRTWAQYIEWSSLGAGILPAAGVWADAPIEVIGVTAEPSPAQLVGAGDAIAVTVTVQNVGSVALPGVTVNGTTAGGVALTNAPQVANNLAPSGTVSLVLRGTVNGDGSLALTLADSSHRPYALATLAYRVDATPPVRVSLAISYVTPGSNTVLGYAADDSPIARFEMEVGGVTTPCIAGETTAAYACTFDAGAAADGGALTLNVRAADVHGNASGWQSFPVVVDATPPQVVLSAAAQTALSDGRLSARELALSGTVTDTVAANTAELCTDNASSCTQQGVLPDASWTLFAPSQGDGVTTTLAFLGYDLAGNASPPVSRTVLVDTVAPQIGLTTVNPAVSTAGVPTLLGSGTVTDGGGVAAVQVFVVRPDSSSTILTATLDGPVWTAFFVFNQPGVYQALVLATDLAGNRATQSVAAITATGAIIPPQILTVSAVGSGAVTPATSTFFSGTVVAITATADAGWSFAGWSGDVVSTTNPIAIALDRNTIITATFSQDAYTVVTATMGSGVITLDPQQDSYRYGAVVTATAAADAGWMFAGWSGAATGATNPVTVTVNSNKVLTGTFVAPRLDVYPALPGIVPGSTVALMATVTPAQAGLAVSFTIASGGGSLNVASATTDANGGATVTYTAPVSTTVAQIDGVLAALPAVRDRATIYVAAATNAGKSETSASGVYTVGNLAVNFIEIVKIGAGTPRMGWSVFAGNPCPASSPGTQLISPFVDVMAGDADGVEAIVVTLRYTDTTSAGQRQPYWCNNGTWEPITATVTVDGLNNTLVFTLTNGSSPTLVQLQGTPFVGAIVDESVPTPPGVQITESSGSTDVTEGGAPDNYSVKLTTQPTANVTVTLVSGAQATVNPTQLVLTPANWNIPQDVAVTAVDDALAEGPHTATIQHSAASAAGDYDGIAVASITVHIADNDSPGVVVTESSGSTDVAEGGAGDSYSVKLTTQPTDNVTVTLVSGAQATVNPTQLVFTPGNWNIPQDVAVTAADDALAEGPHTATIQHSAASQDLNYNGIPVASLTVHITDNDSPGVVVTESNGSTNVAEGGAGDSYSVALVTQPTANVTVTLVSGAHATVNPALLVFTPGNWNIPQEVAVAAVDDALAEGAHTATIQHSAASADGNYNGFSIRAITVYVADNDSFTVVVSANPAAGGAATGGGAYNLGATVTVTATANSGYTFVNWTENGNPVSINAVYNFAATANRTLVANFAINQYIVAVSANPAAGGVNGGGAYGHGATVIVAATANSGYTFVNWTENGSPVSTDAVYSFAATTNRTLVANFALNQYTIAVSANPVTGGGVNGGGVYGHGATVIAAATANSGYTFVNWTENGIPVSTDAVYSFTATTNRTLVANFALNQYTVAVSANPAAGGGVNGGGVYGHGATVIVAATANSGYTFVNWTENGIPVSTDAVYSFAATTNRTLVANFAPLPIAVNDGAGTLQGAAVVIDVLANDLDPAGLGLAVGAVTDGLRGMVAIAGDGQTVTYTPDPAFVGVDLFTYQLRDGNGLMDEALVGVVVAPKTETGDPPQVAPADPAVTATVGLTATQVTLSLELPAGFYTGTLDVTDIFYFVFSQVVTPTGNTGQGPGGLKFGNFVFDLSAYINGAQLRDLQFGEPVTLTITYDPALLGGLRAETLTILYWDGVAWSAEGITVVARDPVNHTITVVLAHLSEFGLFASAPTALEPGEEPNLTPQIYLPVVAR